jgi:hypothetical protein
MLRNLAAALLATTLVAGPAFAAQQSGSTGNMAAPAPAIGTNVKVGAPSTQPAKHLRKHVRSHTRKHVAHRSIHRTKTVHHYTGSKTHKAYVAPTTAARRAGRLRACSPPRCLRPGPTNAVWLYAQACGRSTLAVRPQAASKAFDINGAAGRGLWSSLLSG